MKPKRKVNLKVLQKPQAALLGIFLALTGMLLPLYLLLPSKGLEIPREMEALIFLTVGGVLLSKVIHPFYHWLITSIITFSKLGKLKKDGKIVIPLFFSRWEAVFIKLAPLTDLTLLGLLGLVFLPGFILPLLLTFVSTNLWNSAADAVHAFYILKFTERYQLVRWTGDGFEVWEQS